MYVRRMGAFLASWGARWRMARRVSRPKRPRAAGLLWACARRFDHTVNQQNGENRGLNRGQAGVGFDQQIVVGHAGDSAEVNRSVQAA